MYVHVPFCERICPYCDFPVVAARALGAELESRYVDTLLRELEARVPAFPDRSLASVYFGGGTPALFQPASIERVLRAVASYFPPGEGSNDVEVTLELNPSTVERDRLADFRRVGVNRLSIGIQSFHDEFLKRLGRAHRAGVARDTLATARRAGFANVSIDLMFALPGQTIGQLDRDLEEAIDWSPMHLSTYELTLEPGTPFGRAFAAGRMAAFDEDLAARMIERIEERLDRSDYVRYEISNYAQVGFRSRHNARYWQRQAVLGIGMGSHSFDPRTRDRPHGRRRSNPRTLNAWLEAIGGPSPQVGSAEELTAATARGEAMFLGLRQREGVSASRFEAEFGAVPRRFFDSEIEIAVASGWLEEGVACFGDLRLTSAGRLQADTVAALFVEPPGD
ncbi:MAG: radical SAM family heme chaperone HemW [Myxococcota bacterium]